MTDGGQPHDARPGPVGAHDGSPARPAGPPADRYGRVVSAARRRRRTIVAAAVTAALGALAMLWVGSAVLGVRVAAQEVGFAVVDDGTIELTFIVTKDPAVTAECRVRALSTSFAEVGVADVPIPASAEANVQVTAVIATSERATTAIVQGCRVLAEP